MTFNFYVKAENLQIQGKENAHQLRVELVNLARTNNLNDNVAPVMKNKMNKMASKAASRSSDDEGHEENNTLTYNHLYCLPQWFYVRRTLSFLLKHPNSYHK